VAIYMQYGNITGDATQEGFVDWINLLSFDWSGIDWSITTRVGIQGNTRDAKQPTVKEFTITKESDAASAGLVAAVCTSNTPQPCTIAFAVAGNPARKFLQYNFNNTLIVHFDAKATNTSERPVETFKLNFTEFEMAAWSLTEANQRKTPYRFGPFSVPQGKAAGS
jgi:type VI protein secretion system component Hcp